MEGISMSWLPVSSAQLVALVIVAAGVFFVVIPDRARRTRERKAWRAKFYREDQSSAPSVAGYAPETAALAVAEGDPGNPEVIIIFVHGTWAPDAAWTRSSPLTDYLWMHLEDIGPKARIATQTCAWSGENSFVARAQAAESLRIQLEKNASVHPKALQFMIAHSHGGNIALLALEQTMAKVAGTICLSTPVIVVTGGYRGSQTREEWVLSASAIALVALCIWIYWPLALCLWFLNDWLTRRPFYGDEARDAMRSPNFDELDRENILLIRSHGDEATLALASVSFVAWLSENLMRWPLSRTPWFAHFLVRLMLSIVFAPVPLMLLLAARAFGPEATRSFPRKRVYIEASPPGDWTIYGLRTVEIDGDDPEEMFRHSRAYQSENSSAIILRFIESRILAAREARNGVDPRIRT